MSVLAFTPDSSLFLFDMDFVCYNLKVQRWPLSAMIKVTTISQVKPLELILGRAILTEHALHLTGSTRPSRGTAKSQVATEV